MPEEIDLVDRFEQFFTINYEDEILQKSGQDEDFLKIDFSEVSMFDLTLAEALLEEPEETLHSAKYALERFDTSGNNVLRPRFANLPPSSHLTIREARSKHLDKLHQFQGIVKQKNDVRPQLISATFQCPKCQTKQVIQQTEKKLKTPRKCGGGDCGWKGSFNLAKKDLQDVQKMVLEEAPEELTGGEQPKRINVFLKDDLVSPISDKKTNPGSKIAIVGILKEVPVNLSTGAKSTQFDLIIEGNYVEAVQEEFADLEIDSDQRNELIQASKDPKVYEKLVESIAPSIYGHDTIKEALTLQLFGGCRKSQSDGVNRRGDIHILLIGDPGAGKCVTGDTFITLRDGSRKQIKNMTKGEKILTTNAQDGIETHSITKTYKRTVEAILHIITKNGKEIRLTPEHKLRCRDNTWKPAFTLKKDEEILCYDDTSNKTHYEKIDSISYIKKNVKVYDISVPPTRNFIANNIIAHNSQLLKRMSHVAPKSRFVSGKGASGAGLCVAPDTTLFFQNGERITAESFVENNLNNPTEIKPGVWKQKYTGNKKLLGLDTSWKAHARKPVTIWKLKAPTYVYEITLEDGRQIEITGNTKLLSTENAEFQWKKAESLTEEDYVAVPNTSGQDTDVVPNISRDILKTLNTRRVGKKAFYNIGRKTFQTYVDEAEATPLEEFASSDVRWEKVKQINKKKPDYNYVYDVTIPDSHNFVANNILVHNTASVVKDEFLKGWALEAGALVLANKGLACIDELDKMSQEDASAMHEALEQQSITISKANIQATLKSETTVLAAANPKYGRFDPYEVLAKQIEMPSTLINRFDLIFPIRDVPDKDKDNKLASFILNLHKDDTEKEVHFDTDFIKRYVAFAKQRVDPALSDDALKEIRDYFIQMRNSSKSDDKIQSIPISARQLEGLVRLSEASAKTRLSSTVEKKDAKRAVDLLHYCLTQIGYDQETGEFDIDRITTGVTASQRSQISIIKEIISQLEEEIGKLIPMEDLVQEAESHDIPEQKTDEIIMKLKQGGDIYSPKSGYISRI